MKAVLIVMLILPVFPAECLSGEWHVGDNLICADCHIQHIPEGGERPAEATYETLLLENSVNDLCLSCHNGVEPRAPDVLERVQMYDGSSAAGFFSGNAMENPAGHDLGIESVTPLRTDGKAMELNCASCHAVHGNGNYRNLFHDPARTGENIGLIDGVDLYTAISPEKPPTVSGTKAAYNSRNVGYKSGYSEWCTACHTRLRVSKAGGGSEALHHHHPTDVSFADRAPSRRSEVIKWIEGRGDGFSANGIDEAEWIGRVPYEEPGAIDYVSARRPAETNEVFCGSCHKAHGWINGGGLLWRYLEGGNDFIAGCLQCHDK